MRAPSTLSRRCEATDNGSTSSTPHPLGGAPTWTHTTLANGAELVVTPKHDLPLVSFSIVFVGGSSQFEPAGKTAIANITASMMREGTATRSGDDISEALERLGVSGLGIGIGSESGSVGFLSTTAKLTPMLDVVADVPLHPSFPAPALERLRGQEIVNLTQAKDQPGFISNNVFNRVTYGDAHPYGTSRLRTV